MGFDLLNITWQSEEIERFTKNAESDLAVAIARETLSMYKDMSRSPQEAESNDDFSNSNEGDQGGTCDQSFSRINVSLESSEAWIISYIE